MFQQHLNSKCAKGLGISLIKQKICSESSQEHLCEVLSRFYNAQKDVLNTQEVILYLEEKKHIVEYDIYVLQLVASYIQANKELFLKQKLTINISGETIKHLNGNTALFIKILKPVADKVIFEITETAFLNQHDALFFTNMVRNIGSSIALDDFNHNMHRWDLLCLLKPEIVKLELDPNNEPSLDEIVFYVNKILENCSLNYHPTLVIERIETQSQLDFFKHSLPKYLAGKILYQGWYFDKGTEFIKGELSNI